MSRPVFVDRHGGRRRLVIGVGVLLTAVLVAWLALVGVGMAVNAMPAGPAAHVGVGR